MDESAELLKALRAAAVKSEKRIKITLRAAGVAGAGRSRCVYLGQCCSTQAGQYEPQPQNWVIGTGCWRTQAEVYYRWRLPTGEDKVSIVRADHARQRGVPAPWCAALVLQHRLEKAAEKAQHQWRLTVKDRTARGQCKCVLYG